MIKRIAIALATVAALTSVVGAKDMSPKLARETAIKLTLHRIACDNKQSDRMGIIRDRLVESAGGIKKISGEVFALQGGIQKIAGSTDVWCKMVDEQINAIEKVVDLQLAD